MDKSNELTKEERKVFDRFMRTDIGKKVLANVADFKQGFLDSAMRYYDDSYEKVQARVGAATGVDTVLFYLTPRKATEEEEATEE